MIRPLIAAAAAVLALAGAPDGVVAGFEEGAAAYQAGDHAQAFAEWRPLAEAGDPAAQYNLGILYRQGEGVPVDPEQALDWFRRSAAQGNALAMFNLGLMFGSGDGVPADLPAARAWMALAERRADSEALRRDAAYLGGLLARQIGPDADAAALARAEALAGDAGGAQMATGPSATARPAAAGGAEPAEANRPASAAGTTEAAPPTPPAVPETAETAVPIRPEPLPPQPDATPGTTVASAAVAPASSRPASSPPASSPPAIGAGLDPELLALRPPARPADRPPARSGIDGMRESPPTAADGRIARPSRAGAAAPPLSQSHGEPPLRAAPAAPAATPAPPAPEGSQTPARAASTDSAAPSDARQGEQQEIAALERVTPGGRGLTPPGAAAAGAGSLRGGFAVQIASLLSESDATAQWRRLRAAHPDLLAGLDPMVATGIVDGVTRYRLRLGPFDHSAAETFCRRLTDRGGDCYTVPY